MKKSFASDSSIGIYFIILSCVFYSGLNAVIKLAGLTMSSYNIAFFRGVFCLLTISPFLLFVKFDFIKDLRDFIGGNIARVLLAFGGTYCFAEGLKNTPLNEAVAITFSTPILTCLLSVIILKDKINIEKFIAIFLGIAGVWIILQPNMENINYSSLHVLAAAIIWSISSIIIKIISKSLSPVLMIFYVSLLTVTLSSAYFFSNPYIPSYEETKILLLMGILQNIAQLLMIRAYQKTNLSVIAPFDFIRLILGAILGSILFNEIIELRTITGAVLIIAGCLLVVKKEAKLKLMNKVL